MTFRRKYCEQLKDACVRQHTHTYPKDTLLTKMYGTSTTSSSRAQYYDKSSHVNTKIHFVCWLTCVYIRVFFALVVNFPSLESFTLYFSPSYSILFAHRIDIKLQRVHLHGRIYLFTSIYHLACEPFGRSKLIFNTCKTRKIVKSPKKMRTQ